MAAKPKKKRAMSSEKASAVKTGGHKNEHHFAELIGGKVNLGTHTDKKDVIDAQHRSHSVKSGQWWQVFLYGRERLRTNTIFQGLGDTADIMIKCLDAYPKEYDQYRKDKKTAKQKLRAPMRRLLAELQKPKIFAAFLDKALFDGGNAEYLSLHLGPASTPVEKKHFHVFHKNDVTKALTADVTLANSRARGAGQTDEQKVVFISALHGKQIGQIEDRHDSAVHYREMKFRLNALLVFSILMNHTAGTKVKKARKQVTVYGKAAAKFK